MRCRGPLAVFVWASLSLAPELPYATAQGVPGSPEAPSTEEIAVMGAALEAAYARVTPGWVLVAARTATFECNPPANIGIDVGGCSGMRLADETPEARLTAVRDAIPGISADLAADLLSKSKQSGLLTDALPARVKQVLWAPDLAADFRGNQGDPTFAAYFSRPGFDSTRSRALIYLGTINWTDRSKSMGQYLYLQKERGAWAVTAHAKVWG